MKREEKNETDEDGKRDFKANLVNFSDVNSNHHTSTSRIKQQESIDGS